MESAFAGAEEMTYAATDAPDLSGVANMSSMFADTVEFNGDLSGWDVSQVTDMNSMFSKAAGFNGDISSWNVSSVTDMSLMFSSTEAFNGDISGWNVSSVTDMSEMFKLRRGLQRRHLRLGRILRAYHGQHVLRRRRRRRLVPPEPRGVVHSA